MLNILIDVDKGCRENDIQYFLDWRTLLGAIRHNGFIPWDDEIDITILREKFEKITKIAQEKLGDKYFVQNPETDEYYKYHYILLKVRNNNSKFVEHIKSENEKIHLGIYIYGSIFFVKGISLKGRRIEKWFIAKGKKEKEKLVAGVELFWKNIYNVEDVFPLKTISFEEHEFLGLNNCNNILRTLYGDYIKLPPVEERH